MIASNDEGKTVVPLVERGTEGLTIIDDWSRPQNRLEPVLHFWKMHYKLSEKFRRAVLVLMSRTPEVDRQREHQANERTFLAWLRTSIALIGFSLAIAQFGLFLRQLQASVTQQAVPTNPLFNTENLSLGLVIVAIIMIILAAWRYNQVFWQIERANYWLNRLMVWMSTGVVILLGMLSIPLVLWRDTGSTPSTRSGKVEQPYHSNQMGNNTQK